MKISRTLLLSLSIAALSPLAIKAEDTPVSSNNAVINFASKVWGYTGEVFWDKTGLAAETLKVKTAIEKLGGLDFLKDRDAGKWLVANADTVGRVTLLTTAALITFIAYKKLTASQKDTAPNFDVYFDDEDEYTTAN